MYGVNRIESIKEFRNSSWYQSQFSETLIPSGQISLVISHSGHQSLFSESREKTLSGRSNRRQKTFTAGNFSSELSGELPRDDFFYTTRSAWRRSPICPKAPKPETHPRAVHARFSGRRVRASEPLSGDALPPPSSSDADQPPFLPVFAIRALRVPLLGFFCFRGHFDQFFRRLPVIFSQLQSLHVPWGVFFYLSGR